MRSVLRFVGVAAVAAISVSIPTSEARANLADGEEAAFQFQKLVGSIEQLEGLVELFEAHEFYCIPPDPPTKAQDLALLEMWRKRSADLNSLTKDMQGNHAKACRDELGRSAFRRVTGHSVPVETEIWDQQRQQLRRIQGMISAKVQAVQRAGEIDCSVEPPPIEQPPPDEPTEPPEPPVDPMAGLVPPTYADVADVAVPEGPLCSWDEKKAILDAVHRERQKAADNAVAAAHYHEDVGNALRAGRGDPATLRAQYARADADLARWDAAWAALTALWEKAVALAVIDCEKKNPEHGSIGFEKSPSMHFAASGAYVYQKLPHHNLDSGVVDVGGAESDLLSAASSLDAGRARVDGVLFALESLVNFDLDVFMEAAYAQGRARRSGSVGPEFDLVNGYTFWRRASNGSGGVSSLGSALRGRSELTYRDLDLRVGVKGEFPCGGDEDDDEGYDEEDDIGDRLPDFPGLVGRRFSGPVTFVELGFAVGHTEQDVDQWVLLSHPDAAFADFDAESRANLELRDWTYSGSMGLWEVIPVPGTDRVYFSIGGRVDLGYGDATSDGRQHNTCTVEFAGVPGVNQCAEAIRNYDVKSGPSESGFTYELGTTARLDFEVMPGFVVGGAFDYGFGPALRFGTPTNLDEDGGPRLKREQESSYGFRLQLGLLF